MARSRLPIVIAVVIAVGLAGYLVWQLRAERQSVAQLRERAAALELALRNKPAPALAPPVMTQQEPSAPASAAPATTVAAVPVVAPTPAPPRQQVVVMRPDGTADPDPLAGARFTLALLYGDIEKELGLSKEQMNALAQMVAQGDGSPSRIEALLGAKYSQFLEQARSAGAQRTITSLRTSLASTAHPLTDQQAERLAPAMMAEARRKEDEIAARTKPTDPGAILDYEEQNTRLTEASNERLIAAARSWLEPEQIAVMQSSMSMLVNAQRRNLQARRTRLDAGGSGAVEPAAPIYFYPAGTPSPATTPPR